MTRPDRAFNEETRKEVLWLLRLASEGLEGKAAHASNVFWLLKRALASIEDNVTFVVTQQSGMLKWSDVSPYFDLDTMPANVREALERNGAETERETMAGESEMAPLREFTLPLDWREVIEWIDHLTLPPEIDRAIQQEFEGASSTQRLLIPLRSTMPLTEDDAEAAVRAAEALLSNDEAQESQEG